MKRLFMILILLACCLSGRAQFFSSGDDPARLKWNIIRTPNYRVIYPVEIDSLAQQYSWLLESRRSRVLEGLDIDPEPIEVVLHPYNLNSNGVVSWAPKRMELYTTPQANASLSMPWDLQLVLHESAHVGQMEHFTGKNLKTFYVFFGQMAAGFAAGAFPGQYFLEGDAVYRETLLSPSGRGRSAEFLEHYRASYLSGETRNRVQWRFGSFRKFSPSIYEYGYLHSAFSHAVTGNRKLAGNMLRYMSRHFYNPYADMVAYKEYINQPNYDIYFDNAMDWFGYKWREDYKSREFTDLNTLPHQHSKFYQSYSSPVVLSQDSVFYIKSGYAQPTSLVLVSDAVEFIKEHKGIEKHIRAFSSTTSEIKGNGKFIVWSEISPSARWVHKTNSNIYMMDLKTRKCSQITFADRIFNPMPNDSGTMISAIRYDIQGKTSIELISTDTHEEILEICPPSKNVQLMESIWCNQYIYALGTDIKGKALYRVNADSLLAGGQLYERNEKVWDRVSGYTYASVSSLSHSNGAIYFESDYDGVSNIYCMRTPDLLRLAPESETSIMEFAHRVTNSRFGAHHPVSAPDGRVYYSNLTSDGYEPVYTEVDVAAMPSKDSTIFVSKVWDAADKATIEQYEALYEKPSQVKYEARRYHKFAHLFHVHSWAPMYFNPDRIMNSSGQSTQDKAALGATILSQNKLGTLVSLLGYSYKPGFHGGHFMMEYTGLYPVFKLEADYNSDRRYEYSLEPSKEKEGAYDVVVGNARGHLFEFKATVYIPFNFSKGGWNAGFIPQVSYSYKNDKYYDLDNTKFLDHEMLAGFTVYQTRKIPKSAIYPKWGGGLKLFTKFSPMHSMFFASQFSVSAYSYFPGIGYVDGIRFSADYQKQFVDGKLFYLGNTVAMPRGYPSMHGEHYFKASVDWQVPFHLGDFKIWWLLYARRARLVPFIDVAGISAYYTDDTKSFKAFGKQWTNISSLGAEAYLDGYYLSIGYPASIGMRYSRRLYKGGSNVFEVLFNISLE